MWLPFMVQWWCRDVYRINLWWHWCALYLHACNRRFRLQLLFPLCCRLCDICRALLIPYVCWFQSCCCFSFKKFFLSPHLTAWSSFFSSPSFRVLLQCWSQRGGITAPPKKNKKNQPKTPSCQLIQIWLVKLHRHPILWNGEKWKQLEY